MSIVFFSTMGVLAVGPASATSTWGTAQEVGASLNTQNQAVVLSISCSSFGNCSAGGFYQDSAGIQAFVVSETGGTWGSPQEVAANFNTNGNAQVSSISCISTGNCSAGGYYATILGTSAFVIDEVSGSWGSIQNVASVLDTQSGGALNSISCTSRGNCSAAGQYKNNLGWQAFVVDEVGGIWRTAQEVAGSLNSGNYAYVNQVSCTSTGNCSAGGQYNDGLGLQAFVVDEVGGIWRTAQEVAGALNTASSARGAQAGINSISCTSTGNCSAGGFYTDGSGQQQAFVVEEVSGTWTTAQQVGGAVVVSAISCTSSGNCSATGESNEQAVVVDEVGGIWGNSQEVASALNTGASAGLNTISCTSPGNCSAGGFYRDSASAQAFVVDEVGGIWGTAQEVASALNTGGSAVIFAISCSSPGNCSAGGFYSDHLGLQAFVVDATVPVTPTTIPITTTPAITTPASLAATGTNLTVLLGLAAVFVGLGGLGVLGVQRRRRRI